MKYPLTPLEYAADALEPFIDAETVAIHHGKHQAAYVEKLNAALASEPNAAGDLTLSELLANLDSLPETIRLAVRGNGGGVWNHEFYWRGLSPEKSFPSDELLVAIRESFGSFENFKKMFGAAALSLFGSGWVWLVENGGGKLSICKTPNQDSPAMLSKISGCVGTPLLCFDVWEHAYYLKYRNGRAAHVDALWNIVNWRRASERFERAAKK